MSKTTTARKPTGKAAVRETVKAVRAENAKAHAKRLDNCTKAAAELSNAKLVDAKTARAVTDRAIKERSAKAEVLAPTSRAARAARKQAAERSPLTEAEAVAAGNAWIDAKPGRKERYGVVEATGFEHEGRMSLTTTNFHDLEVELATGKVRYVGVNPHRPQRLRLTSPAKMGKARKSRPQAQAKAPVDTKTAEKELRAKITSRFAGVDWSKLRTVDADKAEAYAEMLTAGTTARAAEQQTGLIARDRMKVEKVMGKAGYKIRRQKNDAPVAGDLLTRWLYRAERASA